MPAKYLPVKYLVAVFTLIAFGAAAQSTYIQAKGMLAQYLLEQAWQHTLERGVVSKPWPWADTWPVAKMTVPALNKSLIILEGYSGEAMAFGPARLKARQTATHSRYAQNGSDTLGSLVIGGHRDTHLAFLQYMEHGQEFVIQTRQGKQTFTWTKHFIANADTDTLTVDADQQALILITCYPFNALQTGGPMRFVVIAEPKKEVGYASRFSSNGYWDKHS